ncbi:MAG: 30S ribosomal protein S4 [Deltaproteobacteria bacterium RIFCSPLOWO2_02_FULL_47_10]|nr:MAG: 30S ribosomal protein S4 [Deltaproteobacteria bacterium RIFCSPLOWO2_02_FULL_47_10]
MAKYTEAVCKLCRRDGLKLFLKGERCFTDKCAIERRAYAPGQHGQSRGKKPTEYAVQLREKQKVKRIYGVLERQFRCYFAMAERMRGITGENLLQLLERRMDNMVYRMGFARSREEARNMVRHGHFHVNGKKLTIPSYVLKQGDSVQIREKSRKAGWFTSALEGTDRHGVPEWLQLNKDKCSATVAAYPARDQITMPINEQLIVELYSK